MSNIIKQWNGRTIRVREDRYVSLTDMAQASGNRVDNWFRLNGTASYLSALSKATGLPVKSPFPQKSVTVDSHGFQPLVEINQGGIPENQGTWGHPKVALRFAQWCSDEFAVQVDMWVDELMTTGQVSLTDKKPQQLKDIVWQRRLVLFLEKTVIPYDYFCIFTEATCGLIAQFETIGYVLPESATIDISIGQHWATFLKTQFNDIEIYRQKYPHYYPDSRGQIFANMYKLDLLPMFRRWMETDYKMWHLEDYLKKKDRQALYVLADLMGEPLLPGIVDDLTKKKLAG